MTSRIPILIAASALAGCAQTPRSEAPAQASNPLKVATWNLEHLAENDGTGCRPRSEADYAELRHQADLLNADVIAIEAVESKAAAERVFEPSRYDVVMSARRVSGRSGACYGKPGQSIRHQAVGFAIRKGVSWSRNRDLSALGLGNPDLRWGVDITINGARPLRLLAVHLKSGCNSGRAPSDDDCTVLSTSCLCSKAGSMHAPKPAKHLRCSATGTAASRHAATCFWVRSTMANRQAPI